MNALTGVASTLPDKADTTSTLTNKADTTSTLTNKADTISTLTDKADTTSTLTNKASALTNKASIVGSLFGKGRKLQQASSSYLRTKSMESCLALATRSSFCAKVLDFLCHCF